MRDPENTGDIRKSVGVGHGKFIDIVEQYRKCDIELLDEGGGIFLIVLRNADESNVSSTVIFVNPIQKRKSILADRAGNFEKRGNHWTAGERIPKRKILSCHGWQSEVGRFLPRRKSGHVWSSENILKPFHSDILAFRC